MVEKLTIFLTNDLMPEKVRPLPVFFKN